VPPPDQAERGRELMKAYNLGSYHHLTDCSTCHR
jgi:hypothetical protein